MTVVPRPTTQQLIAALWERNQPQTRKRLDVLDRAAAGPLTDELRDEAIATAHKLAGSLGMFGFAEGSRLARELEFLLESPEPTPASLRDLATLLRAALGEPPR